MRDLNNRVVVLTGASSGIGRSIALALAKQDVELYLVARRGDRLEEVASVVRSGGGRATTRTFDVRDSDAWQQLVRDIHEQHGRLDILINDAGVGATKTFLETTDDDWRWTFDINLHAMVTGIRTVLPGMLERGDGVIVNVASLAGVSASVLTAYTASKYAVVGLSEALMLEYGHKGIDVIVVCPGLIDTEIAEAANTAGHANAEVGASMQQALTRHGVSPDVVAKDVVRALRRPRFLVTTPTHATLLRLLHRWFPGLSRTLSRKMASG